MARDREGPPQQRGGLADRGGEHHRLGRAHRRLQVRQDETTPGSSFRIHDRDPVTAVFQEIPEPAPHRTGSAHDRDVERGSRSRRRSLEGLLLHAQRLLDDPLRQRLRAVRGDPRGVEPSAPAGDHVVLHGVVPEGASGLGLGRTDPSGQPEPSVERVEHRDVGLPHFRSQLVEFRARLHRPIRPASGT